MDLQVRLATGVMSSIGMVGCTHGYWGGGQVGITQRAWAGSIRGRTLGGGRWLSCWKMRWTAANLGGGGEFG